MEHLGWKPADFEFHGHELWGGQGYWRAMDPPRLIAAYEAVLSLLNELSIDVAHSSINKPGLRARHNGARDGMAYRLALQFLLEKIDYGQENKILIADEAKEQELEAVKMVAGMQQWDSGGVVPGRTLNTIIDSLHFVRSHDSAGVQMSDLVAFILQRRRQRPEGHPDAQAARTRLGLLIDERTYTWREPWPPVR